MGRKIILNKLTMDNWISSDENKIPDGVWKKTHQIPKPVGVPIWIKKDGKIFQYTHAGNPTFESDGKIIQNTVYSYDKNEYWLDTQVVHTPEED